jgi:hypothetical protein
MRWFPWLLAAGATTVVGGCEGIGTGKDADGTGDTAGGGGDDDDNGGGDDDDNGTTPTNAPDDLDCDATYATPDPGSPASCVTEEIHCGDTLYGHLDGGSTVYDYDFWYDLQALDALFGEYEALDGAERSYLFRDTDVDQAIKVTVHTCFEMWATWIVRDADYCESSALLGGVFESGDGNLWYTERIDEGGEYEFEFVVEGVYGDSGNYAITVECF